MTSPAVVLVNLGTPAAPTEEAVRAFLAEFLADPLVVDWPRWIWMPVLRRIVLRRRPARVALLYASIWTEDGSPLAVSTARLAADLGARLAGRARVVHAYRYGTPGLAAVLREIRATSSEVAVVPLFAQPTASSTGTIERLVGAVAAEDPAAAPLRFRMLAPDESRWIAALAARVREALATYPSGSPPEILASYHGIPARVDRGERHAYRDACFRTTAALERALDLTPGAIETAFQSRFGPERWLAPATADRLVEHARRGSRRLLVVAPGFLTPGLETLEELGIRGREAFLAAGGEAYAVAASPAGRPEVLDALESLLERPIERTVAL